MNNKIFLIIFLLIFSKIRKLKIINKTNLKKIIASVIDFSKLYAKKLINRNHAQRINSKSIQGSLIFKIKFRLNIIAKNINNVIDISGNAGPVIKKKGSNK